MGSDLKIVPLDEDCKPHIGSLEDRIRNVIADAAEEEHVTLAEIVGVLEIIKTDLIKEAEEDAE